MLRPGPIWSKLNPNNSIITYSSNWGIQEHSWLRYYAIRWNVASSIPDEVIGFFNSPNPSSCTMVLGLTQSVTKMSTRNLPEGKGWPAHKVDNLTATCEPLPRKCGSLNVSQPYGPPWPITGIALPFLTLFPKSILIWYHFEAKMLYLFSYLCYVSRKSKFVGFYYPNTSKGKE
jgi:hypothetical protein